MLKAFWGDRFSVQCTGGDASFPGAQRQDLHADVPVKEVADQPHDWSTGGFHHVGGRFE